MMTPFDLKYRPRLFRDVLGNTGVIKLLLNRSKNDDLQGRSMMFGGVKGCGKTTISRIVAKAIGCTQTIEGEPCLVCDGCKAVESDSSYSYDEFDAATQGTVDKIREILNDVEYGTIDGKPRVVVLDEAHRLTKQAQDALLRPMEDRRIVIILCTTEPHNIRSAIRDRVEEYPISHPNPDDVLKRIKEICECEDIKYENDALKLLISINSSNPRTSFTGLQSSAMLGDITYEAIRSIYRFDSKEKVIRVLELLDCNLKGAFQELEELFQNEGSMWVRDEIVSSISSSIRAANGAKTANTKARAFYSIRGIRWADLAKDLALLDRPDAADVECVLLSSVQVARTIGTIEPYQNGMTVVGEPDNRPESGSREIIGSGTGNSNGSGTIPITFTSFKEPEKVPETPVKQVEKKSSPPQVSKPKEEKPIAKSVEIDGIIFTKNEELTSLDGKIGKGSSSRPPATNDFVESPRIQQDPRLAPIPEKEFAREFIKGFKRT